LQKTQDGATVAVPQNQYDESGLLILASRGYRLEAHPKREERPTCRPGGPYEEFRDLKEESHGYGNFCD
jgi:hypothetical protein